MKQKLTLLLSFTALVGIANAQSDVYIHFLNKVGGVQIQPSDLGNTVYHDLNGIAFEVDVFL